MSRDYQLRYCNLCGSDAGRMVPENGVSGTIYVYLCSLCYYHRRRQQWYFQRWDQGLPTSEEASTKSETRCLLHDKNT